MQGTLALANPLFIDFKHQWPGCKVFLCQIWTCIIQKMGAIFWHKIFNIFKVTTIEATLFCNLGKYCILGKSMLAAHIGSKEICLQIIYKYSFILINQILHCDMHILVSKIEATILGYQFSSSLLLNNRLLPLFCRKRVRQMEETFFGPTYLTRVYLSTTGYQAILEGRPLYEC